jgi:hypothetical protein
MNTTGPGGDASITQIVCGDAKYFSAVGRPKRMIYYVLEPWPN